MRGILSCGGKPDFGREHRLALRDQNLRAHEVDAGDHFRDRVLHLDARIHLDEEPFVPVQVVEEFHGAGVVVTDLLGDARRRKAKLLAHMIVQPDARRDLDDLLMAPLHRAIALVQMQDVAVLVARASALRCAWRAEYISRGRPRGCQRRGPLRACASSSRLSRSADLCTTRMPRPPPPNAALMMSGKPIVFATFNASSRSLIGSSVPGKRRDVRSSPPDARAAVLSPIMSSNSGRGPTKVMPASAQARANSAFSREKAVAGMNQVHALFLAPARRCLGYRDRRATGPLPFADEIRFVRLEAMHAQADLPARKSRRCAAPIPWRREKRGWQSRCDWQREAF